MLTVGEGATMTIRSYLAMMSMSAVLFSTQGLANQASTEYVQKALESLRGEVSSRINSLVSTTNQLSSTLVTLQKEQQAANVARMAEIKAITPKSKQIGELYQGGLVFYLDESGQHGLVATLSDLDVEALEWRNGESGDRITNAKGLGLYAGESNTRLIIAAQTIDNQEGRFAALSAANYQVQADGLTPCEARITCESLCYGGWHLPSLHELLTLYTVLKAQGLGDFTDATYWSSTEVNTTEAWLVDFATGNPLMSEKLTAARLRAVHAF
ncbi:DUF1566 domain-containing protein [Legionella feeleii]|uniref:Legionella vir region protein n=1 Tax=Legionella feeleii TaxID=453 RepID=A0A378IVP1_9GAMM|nr:DUF1566 domain-containing protein [Legionella feeleii]STX39286.1 Legionella vir region protein [Legionella feeleii]